MTIMPLLDYAACYIYESNYGRGIGPLPPRSIFDFNKTVIVFGG
jgi:hypothetical protein